jgi:signal transduction histidine kinase
MRRRLLTSYLALTFFVLLVLEVPLAVGYESRSREQLTTGLQRDAFVLAGFGEDSVQGKGTIDLQQLVTNYQDRTGGRVVIVDANGNALADSDPTNSGARSFADRPEFAAALNRQVATGTRHSDSLNTDLLYVAVPISSGGDTYGAVRVSYSTSQINERVRHYWLVLAGIGAVCLAAAAVLGIMLSRWVVRPLERLEGAALQLGSGELSTRAPTDNGPPEVRALAASFNDMAGRLEELVDAQESFVADASHQLRTPLTALRLRLENLEAQLDDPEAIDDLAAARAETGRLSRLVDGLLALAHADRRRSQDERVPVALDDFIAERVDVWRPVSEEYGVNLAGQGNGLRVLADPDRLAQVLDNLLANATDVSPDGSRLTVRATPTRDGRRVEIHVEDEGPGLDLAQRQHAFDRFWRAEGGRASGGREELGGSGLGLAIVRQLVMADGGEVKLAESTSGGVDAIVTLERPPA